MCVSNFPNYYGDIHIIMYTVGVLWPLEGMPTALRYIGSILPMTYPAQAMRAAMGRGTTCCHRQLY